MKELKKATPEEIINKLPENLPEELVEHMLRCCVLGKVVMESEENSKKK